MLYERKQEKKVEEEILENEAQTVGEMLKVTRLKQGKTLSDVSKVLCIRKAYLTAIEDMDVKNIPGMPYSLGFVRSYASYLGLNSDRVVSSYKKIISGVDDEEDENQSDKENSGPSLKHIFIASVGLILLAILWLNWPFIKETKEKITESDVSEISVPEPEIINSDDTDSPDSTDVTDSVSATQEESISEASETQETEEVKKEESVIKNKIKFVLTGPSWIELKHEDKVLLSGIYRKGYTYEIPQKLGMVVSIGRYYNVKFFSNEKPAKIISSTQHINVNLDEAMTD